MSTKQRFPSDERNGGLAERRTEPESARDSLLGDEDPPDLRFAIVATFAIALAGALLVIALL